MARDRRGRRGGKGIFQRCLSLLPVLLLLDKVFRQITKAAVSCCRWAWAWLQWVLLV